jgi:hypothetical protein
MGMPLTNFPKPTTVISKCLANRGSKRLRLIYFSPTDFCQPLPQYSPLIVVDVVKAHAHRHRLRPDNQTTGCKGRTVPLQLDSDLRPHGQRPFGVHETTQKAHVRSLGMQPNTRPQFNNLGIDYEQIAR